MSSPPELHTGRAARLFWRAVRLRCPNCGARGILQSWFRLQPRCPNCGLRLERGETDYFLGAYMFNLVIVELLFAAAMAVVILATRPDPPWALIEYGGAVLMIAGAIVCYPLAKTTWLAFDLALRPMTPEELDWHRTGKRPPDSSLPHL